MARTRTEMSAEERAEWGAAKEDPELVSGRVSSLSLGTPGATPGRSMSVFGTNFPTVAPRVLVLGGAPANYDPAGAAPYFPVGDGLTSFLAGIYTPTSVNLTAPAGRYAAAVLTYGTRAAQARVVFDWRAGNFNLPPCEQISLEVLLWGGGWAGQGELIFSAASGRGQMLDAHVPTLTQLFTFTGAGSATFAVPARARAADVCSLDASPAYKVKLYGNSNEAAVISRDYVNTLFAPPWAPVDMDPGVVKLEVDAAAKVEAKFFLSL